MDLMEFFRGNDQIYFVEIVSFPRLQPNIVVLGGPEGRVTHVTVEMWDIEERLELGVLKFGDGGDPSKGEKETFPGGRVLAVDYLAAPGFDLISGVRIKFTAGELIVIAGDMPYSIFVKVGTIERGRPEYPLEQYRAISAE
jgi:hypothetical protein